MNRLDFYEQHYRLVAEPLLDMMRRGIRVDTEEANRQQSALAVHKLEVIEQLDTKIGAATCACTHSSREHSAPVRVNIHEGLLTKAKKPRAPKWKVLRHCLACECQDFTPVVKSLQSSKGLSSTRTAALLYDTYGLPKYHKKSTTGKESVTTDEVAIRKCLMRVREAKPITRETAAFWRRFPQEAANTLELILQYREYSKLAQYLDAPKFDFDNHLRCTYKVTTENGRLASSKNPRGSGYNLQNIPRPGSAPHTLIRRIFVPDEGHVLLEADYSQIEDRIVKVLTKDPTLIAEARTLPTEFDAHTTAAQRGFSLVLGVDPRDVDVKVEVTPGTTRRDVFKVFNHASNYGASAKRVQGMLIKDGIYLPKNLCEELLEAALTAPKLAFQKETRQRIMRDRKLTNSWGRTLDFSGERLDDSVYRRGYAFRGASENADNLNQLGMLAVYQLLVKGKMKSRLIAQVHDSVVLSCAPSEVYDVATFLNTSMSTPREYEGVELSVPVEFKLGSSWVCSKSYKQLPTREVLERDVRELLG